MKNQLERSGTQSGAVAARQLRIVELEKWILRQAPSDAWAIGGTSLPRGLRSSEVSERIAHCHEPSE